MISIKNIETPVGKMVVGIHDNRLCLLDFEYRKMLPAIKNRVSSYCQSDFSEQAHELHDTVSRQLNEYFAGDRMSFDLPLLFTGTDFQQKVWNALLEVPYGSTRTYMQQTRLLGDEKAIRAVARANGENCLAIVVPCHRVVGADGSLTGYAGGLSAKKWLLEHEARHSGKAMQASMF